MKAAFLGTPGLAVASLDAVHRRHDVRLVVTQPDRPRGRGRHTFAPPVKVAAQGLGLPVWQPESVKGEGPLARLRESGAEILVVVAYGLFLPAPLLEAFPRGAVNLHFSLLPAYRGAAPLNWAIIKGERRSGVSTFRLTPRMDAGPVYRRRATEILPGETAGELGERLAVLGASVLEETLEGIEGGTVDPAPQDESLATLAPKLSKEDGRIDWNGSVDGIVNLVRGVNPWPGAFTSLGEGVLKIWRARAAGTPPGPGTRPGTVLGASSKEGLVVAARGGAVALEEVQPEGKRRMSAGEFLTGHRLAAGAVLG